MGLNVSNMEHNTLYKFADNSYVWTIKLNESRKGYYRTKEPVDYTEVYKIDGTGHMVREVSGRLVNNPAINDYDHRFSIFDYDDDTMYTFLVEGRLKKANLDELYSLRRAISIGYESRNR